MASFRFGHFFIEIIVFILLFYTPVLLTFVFMMKIATQDVHMLLLARHQLLWEHLIIFIREFYSFGVISDVNTRLGASSL